MADSSYSIPVQLLAAGPDDVFGVGQAERHEQQTGLVDVAVVVVDDGDLTSDSSLREAVRRSACRPCRRRG